MLKIGIEVLKLTNLHLGGSNRVFLLFSGTQRFQIFLVGHSSFLLVPRKWKSTYCVQAHLLLELVPVPGTGMISYVRILQVHEVIIRVSSQVDNFVLSTCRRVSDIFDYQYI